MLFGKFIAEKIFGLPRSLGDFADEAKRNKKDRVDVILIVSDYGYEDKIYERSCYVALQAGESRLELSRHSHVRLDKLYGDTLIGTRMLCLELIDQAAVERSALKAAVDAAEKLQERGLEATIEGGPVDKTRDAIAGYDDCIAKMKGYLPRIQHGFRYSL